VSRATTGRSRGGCGGGGAAVNPTTTGAACWAGGGGGGGLDCSYWLVAVEFSDEAGAHVHLDILRRQIVGGAITHIDDHANESPEEKVPAGWDSSDSPS
jgi:hypothetical protein